MKDWIWGRRDIEGNIPKPQGLPSRAYWYVRLASKYIAYKKFPWEMGYPHYEELDNIFPFIVIEWNKRVKQESEKKSEWEKTKSGL